MKSWKTGAILGSTLAMISVAVPGAAQVRGTPSETILEPFELNEGPGEDYYSSNPDTAVDPGVSAGPTVATDEFTTTIVAQVRTSVRKCEAVGTAYRTDCLAKELQSIVKKLPSEGEYAVAHEALSDAADELSDLSRANRDYTQPGLRVTVQSQVQGSRAPVYAVKPETEAAINTKALAVLEATTTVLLRSAASNRSTAVHYQQIAQALNSSKVLLRS